MYRRPCSSIPLRSSRIVSSAISSNAAILDSRASFSSLLNLCSFFRSRSSWSLKWTSMASTGCLTLGLWVVVSVRGYCRAQKAARHGVVDFLASSGQRHGVAACRDRVSEGQYEALGATKATPSRWPKPSRETCMRAPDVSMRPRGGPKGGSRRSAQTPPLMAACEARR